MFGAAGGAGYAYAKMSDPKDSNNIVRAVKFWSTVGPIYAHYKYTEWSVEGKPEAESTLAFETLHNRYAPVTQDLVLSMKGYFIKLAQMASTRDDFVPLQYLKFFKTLQDQAPYSLSETDIQTVVEGELGRPLDEVFESIELTPFASATIGQVHKAITKDGTKVAVKIQSPNSETQFHGDVDLVLNFCKLAMPQHVQPLTELKKQFVTEFDYTLEAKQLKQVCDNIMPTWGSKVCVPEPLESLCSKRVLVMTYLEGVRLIDGIRAQYQRLANDLGMTLEEFEDREKSKENEDGNNNNPTEREMYLVMASVQALDWAKNTGRFFYNYTLGLVTGNYKSYRWTSMPLNIPAILRVLFDVHAHQLLVDGVFNGDPHPGNVLLCADGRLGLVDFGQVGHLNPVDKVKLAKLLLALAKDDKGEAARLLTVDMGYQFEDMNNVDNIWRTCTFYFDRDDKEITQGLNPMQFMEHLEATNHVEFVPRNWVLAGRMCLILRGFGNALHYPVSIARSFEPYALDCVRAASV